MTAVKHKGSGGSEKKLTYDNEEKMQKEVQFENETNSFIQGMSALLAETVKQHYIVNSEHYILGELADNVKAHMNEISRLSSVGKVEQEVKELMETLTEQKKQIENMSKEIVDVDQILKITSETIIKHIEDASIVDGQLEETERQLEIYSKIMT